MTNEVLNILEEVNQLRGIPTACLYAICELI